MSCESGFDCGFIHQQNGNVVAHRIHSPAFAALQARAIFFLRQRLLAGRANQNFHQVLGNHEGILLPALALSAVKAS